MDCFSIMFFSKLKIKTNNINILIFLCYIISRIYNYCYEERTKIFNPVFYSESIYFILLRLDSFILPPIMNHDSIRDVKCILFYLVCSFVLHKLILLMHFNKIIK